MTTQTAGEVDFPTQRRQDSTGLSFVFVGSPQFGGMWPRPFDRGMPWEAALERFTASKDQTPGIPLSPTGLSRQGTRKIGVLGRTNTLTRQATMNLSTAGGKRAQALDGLKTQVEDLKTQLQVCLEKPQEE